MLMARPPRLLKGCCEPRMAVAVRERAHGAGVLIRAVQRSIHDAHGEDCTDAAEGYATPTSETL